MTKSKCTVSSRTLLFISASLLSITSFAQARSEREILEELYKTTEGPRWKNSDGWMDDNVGICEWYGVKCENSLKSSEIGVERINLRDNSLIGKGTSLIYELPFLKELILADNFLTEFSFQNIQLASSLKRLDLSDNGLLSIDGISFVPKNLESIHLSDNQLKGPFPEEITKLDQIGHVYLGHNFFTGEIPASISNMKNLEILDLNYNKFSGTLPTEFGDLVNLKKLYLGDNYFTGIIPDEFMNLLNLKVLSIPRGTRNQEEGKEHVLAGPFPAFSTMVQLNDLELAGNSFTGKLPSRLLKGTEIGSEKIIINLHDNELTGTIPGQYGDRFERLFIDLTGNNIEEISSRLCDKTQWMGGDVGIFGCDAILCPLGTANFQGRQTTANSTCVPCIDLADATYLGHTECFKEMPIETNASEKDILSRFYDALDGENWSQNSNWMKSNDICDWHGIICASDKEKMKDNEIDPNLIDNMALDGQVVGISLSANRLAGRIPGEIFLLPSLIYLDVGRNTVDFPLSGLSDSKIVYLTLTDTNLNSLRGIANPPFLRNLKADRNEMTGTIPIEIFDITTLHRLDLSFNFFTGSLPNTIANLQELRRLRLYGNELKSTIPTEIGLLSRLVILDIGENDFSGQLPTEMNNLVKLNELVLHQTNRDGPGLEGSLPDFSKLMFLTTLALDSNEFTGQIPDTFLSGVLDSGRLMKISLSWNNLVGTLPASLDRFRVMNIDLVGNQITGIAPELCDNEDWMDGMVKEFGCDAIMCPIGKYNADGLVWNSEDPCRDCVSADVYGSVHCIALAQPKVTTERDTLESLFYATGGRTWTQPTNWTVPWIPICSWEGITCVSDFADADLGVEEIDLENFGLGGEIPSEIFDLPSLRRLNLRGNEIDFSFDSIENATLLETLILSETGLSSLDGIESALNLKLLDISRNSLTGRLPEELFSLTELQILNLAHNSYSGDFPDSVYNLIKLEELNCFNNKFQGQLPTLLKTLTNLRILNFGQNRFEGPFPPIVLRMFDLEIIDFSAQASEDGISGALPDFSNFMNLKNLKLDYNSLTGTIPFTFLDNVILTNEFVSIGLAFNKLSGTIPASLGKFNELSINLIENHIVGIPNVLCDSDHGNWMGGTVQSYGCDAILCPKGSTNVFGLQNSLASECKRCENGRSAPYMGMTQCLSQPEIQLGSEADILIEFYKQTDGLMWKTQTNWLNMEVDVCKWHGIVCGDKGIEEIRLPNNNLNGSPLSLYNLPYLKLLDLSINSFLEISFAGLGNATSLEILILAGTNMKSLEGISAGAILSEVNVAGNLISGRIPDEIFEMKHLHRLFMSYNDFDGPLSPKIGNLDKLRWLFMSNNKLSGPLPDEIGSLTKLIRLDVSSNRLTGNLPASLLNLKKIEALALDTQKDGFSGSLLDFKDAQALSSLSLQKNHFSGSIPSTFLANSNKKSQTMAINLSFNNLSGSIPVELGEFKELNIDLVGNSFTDLPSSICDDTSGNGLWMNGNVNIFECAAILCPAGRYSETGRQEELAIPCMPCVPLQDSEVLGNTECDKTTDSATSINVPTIIDDDNFLSEREILKELFRETGGETWTINLNWNEENIGICEWYGITCFPDRANDDEGVIAIEMNNDDDSGNNLAGFIPPQIFNLPSLQVLNLKGNQIDIDFTKANENNSLELLYLSDTSLTTIEGINAIRSVKELHLTDAGAAGDIDFIFEMKLLTAAYLSYNHLSGSLSRIGELKNLERMYAINNDITGYIPPSIGALSKLNTVALSGNFITGKLPDSLSKLPELEAFASLNDPTRGPGFTGKLIDFSGTKIKQLVLNHNSLTGSIPTTFLQGTDTDVDGMMIWLSYNYLSGVVPIELDRFNSIDLVLEGNQFTSLSTELCDNDNNSWMRGGVESFGCDSILCPPGTFNQYGRQKHESEPCVQCPESSYEYFGSVSCEVYSERYVLKQLYLATGGQNWDKNENWLSDDVGICDWFGISCAASSLENDSEVTSINLEENLLVGVVPQEIFQLPHIEHINLKSNKIDLSFANVPIPKSLIELELSDTKISNLNGISTAKSIKRLHLGNTSLKGTIPDEIFELEDLVELYLSYNELSGTLSSNIGNLKDLKYFTLFDNHIHGPIPSEIGELTDMKELVLSQNDFSGSIPMQIENLVNLISLSMYGREDKGVGLSGPLPAFSRLSEIKEVVLDYNSLTGTIPPTFLASATKTDDIQVGLSWNHLVDPLPITLDRFFSLDIELVGNMISSIPVEFCDNKKWMGGKVQDFSCDAILCPKGTANDFGRQSLERDPCQKCDSSLSTLYSGSTKCVMSERSILKKLYSQCDGANWNNKENWGDDNVDICLWDAISCGQHGHVDAILLGSNNIRGIPPKELFDLPYLHTLWMYSNPVQFSFRGIENARKLESLLLDSTGIDDLDGLENAIHLRELGLRFNELTGFLPTELATLRNLETLSLSENGFSGLLPTYLEKMTNLKKLRIGSNVLSGPLLDFNGMPNLYSLDLSENKLTGTIPQAFLSDVPSDTSIVVDLSSNSISGEVPATLGRLKELSLYIRDNEIDNVPAQLCKQRDWNDAGVSQFGCEAIACPPGTYNEHGRMKSSRSPCIKCADAQFYGSITCANVLSDDVVNSDTSRGSIQQIYWLSKLVIYLTCAGLSFITFS